MESQDALSSVDWVKETLYWIKRQLGARALGLFDDDLANLAWTSETSPEVFGDIFRTSPCWSFNRENWHCELRSRANDVRYECECSVRHTADGYLIHDRWILMVLFEGFPPMDPLDFSIQDYLQRLPPKPPRARIRRGSPAPLEARVGIPVWWVRGPR